MGKRDVRTTRLKTSYRIFEGLPLNNVHVEVYIHYKKLSKE